MKPGDYVMLSVSDTGVGMAEDVLERVFEPFFTTKDVGKGTGLGLSMIFGFVEHSGGQVEISSTEGDGTTVKLYFPRSQARRSSDKAADTPVSAVANLPKGDESILVVEDNSDVRAFVVDALRTLGYEVFEAEDGASALEFLNGPSTVNLLLSDIVMPGGMSGFEVAERTGELYPEMKVLFISGYTDHPLFSTADRDRAAEILAKPFTREALAHAVRRALTRPAT
jgi:CheY-like chemotaxis protein